MNGEQVNKRDYLFVFLLGLVVNLIPFIYQSVPGYMDAEYYYVGGIQLTSSHGFQDPFIWNYLNNPGSLPVPSHAYWMPLASLFAAAGMFIFSVQSYLAAKSFFLLFAAIYPCLTASLSYRLYPKRGLAWWVAGVSIFSGFFFVFYTLTESFILYAVLGSILFHLLISLEKKPDQLGFVFAIGLIAGGLHLSRADGVLWVVFLFFSLVLIKPASSRQESGLMTWIIKKSKTIALLLLGYLLVTGFWYIRNIWQWGSIFPPGGSLTIWITNYDQIFIYPGVVLTYEHWIASGLGNIISARISSLGANLITAFAVQGLVLLIPAMVIGLWSTRKLLVTRIAFGMWLVILFVMSFVFPFAGARGGFFHSVAGVQPLFIAVSGIGMELIITKVGTWRKWNTHQALIVFSSGALVICMAISAYLLYQRVLRSSGDGSVWAQSFTHYEKLGKNYKAIVGEQATPVAVNDPPGFYLATGLECVVIPDGDMNSLTMISEKFGVRYVIIEENTVKYLVDAYDHPGEFSGLDFIADLDGGYLYEIKP
jgi:hypothetical protein